MSYTDTEFSDTEVQGEDPNEAEAAQGGRKPQARPSYELEVLGDELPEQDSGRKGGGPRESQWLTRLAPIVEDESLHNTWLKVVTYTTAAGAGSALKAIREDGRQVPDGDWEFEARRVNDPETGKRVSYLAAKYVTA